MDRNSYTMRSGRQPFRCVVQVLCSLMLLSCVAGEKDAARSKVDEFRGAYNRNDCAQMYSHTSDVLRATLPRDKFCKSMEETRLRFGRVKSDVLVRTEYEWTRHGHAVSVEYDTAFDRGAGHETFTWLIKDEIPRLVKYEVQVRK